MNYSNSKFEIDTYIKDESSKKKNIYKICLMLSCLFMLIGVVGIIIIFRFVGNMEYRRPVDEFFTEAETKDYSDISEILFPGLSEYLDISDKQDNEFITELRKKLSEYAAYRIDKTEKLSSGDLKNINSRLVECTNREAEEAYRMKVIIDSDTATDSTITTDVIVGCYEKKWYIISMSKILEI